MTLHRVFPYDDNANPTEPGGALFVPQGGDGRVDNPDLYRAFYASTHAEGAVAEKFGRIPEWDSSLFEHPAGLPYAIAAYTLAPAAHIFELDNAEHLNLLNLRPSEVVRRDLQLSQGWARTIFGFGEWDGVSWWSFYGPQWHSVAVWNLNLVSLHDTPQRLLINSSAVVRAAAAIVRLIRS